MRVLLTAINAKYIHSNLAVYSLRAYAAPYRDRIETAEFTINQQQDYILQRIYEKKPDILAFSCYIWNVETVLSLVRISRWCCRRRKSGWEGRRFPITEKNC